MGTIRPTVCTDVAADFGRPEPLRQDEPRHHGRQRRGRPHNILPRLRYIFVGTQEVTETLLGKVLMHCS
jgi:hypothetical protein